MISVFLGTATTTKTDMRRFLRICRGLVASPVFLVMIIFMVIWDIFHDWEDYPKWFQSIGQKVSDFVFEKP